MLIADRNGMVSTKKSAPTARDYVKDGLITMLDGEWNVGEGLHETSPQTWIDISGNGNDFDVVNSSVFGSDHAVVNGTGFAMGQMFSLAPSMKHVEIVVERDDAGSGIGVVFTQRNTGGKGGGYADFYFFWRPNGKVEIVAYDLSNPSYIGRAIYCKKGSAFSAGSRYSISSGDGKIYVNGSEIMGEIGPSTLNISGNFIASAWSATSGYLWTGKIYSIRYYNRVLTDAELAANYAVDSIRFNLTGGGRKCVVMLIICAVCSARSRSRPSSRSLRPCQPSSEWRAAA